jgi:hypothetical protein
MKRKITRQKTAYTVTLPIKWIRDHSLEGSDEVEILEDEEGLKITTDNISESKKVSLHLKKGIDHYYRINIENHYLRGDDILEITFEDKDAMNIIQEIVSNLNGFEIVKQKDNYCKIAETAHPTIKEVKTIMDRLLNIIKYTHTVVLEDIIKNKFDNQKLLDQLISDTRRFSLFCRRAIHKQALISRIEEVFADLLLERLVITNYDNYFLYQKLNKIKSDEKINKEVISLYEKSGKLYELFYKMYHKSNTKEFTEINHLWNKIYFDEGPKLSNKCNEKEFAVIYHSMAYSYIVFLMAQPNTIKTVDEIRKKYQK